LALLYLHPEEEFSLTQVAQLIGVSVKSVHVEANRLVEGGLVAERRIGNVRMIRIGESSPLTRPLTDLLAVTYGPLPVLRDLLSSVEGVTEAYIYGSWAARYRGENGPVPGDVDVLLVGGADRDVLDQVARDAEQRLHREVNIRRVRPEVWRSPDPQDPFLASLRMRPLVDLDLPGAEVRPARTAPARR
jgi:predicted nucleotidyltransferase